MDWDKERAFRDDLAALVASIAIELAAADPAMATDRLLRFIATHEAAFERIDDSGGHIQDIYAEAIEALAQSSANWREWPRRSSNLRVMKCGTVG